MGAGLFERVGIAPLFSLPVASNLQAIACDCHGAATLSLPFFFPSNGHVVMLAAAKVK